MGFKARQLESSLSSVVEHILHTDGVSGSNPLASTSLRQGFDLAPLDPIGVHGPPAMIRC